MADDPNIRQPQDRARINVNQEHELRHWSKKFGVSEDDLRKAVQQVGPMAENVARHLGRGESSGQPSSSQRFDNVKGEGNYKAAREFDEAERKFVQSGDLEKAVRNTAPSSEAEERELEDAEEQARRRAKEEDPALFRKPKSRQGNR